MPYINRRNFLRTTGVTILPALVPAGPLFASAIKENTPQPPAPVIDFFNDGRMYTPEEYLNELQQINAKTAIKRDYYGKGGAVTALEKEFEKITGKEKSMFMPTGTMANQLAITVLSGSNTKVFVQDTSHVYRDEADAAQSVFQKRLMPLAKEETFFTVDQLKNAINALQEGEVFQSGIGAVSIENPVRRKDEQLVPLEEIKKISEYCRSNDIKLHLDGARIYMAAAWSGISVKEYAAYFDTIYISLYKYLGAHAGAVLCGEKKVMDKMDHLVKIHGGTQFGNWTNAIMALHRLDGIDKRLKDTIALWNSLIAILNKEQGVNIIAFAGGTNHYYLQLTKEINGKKMREVLATEFNIRIAPPNDKNEITLVVNETLLYRDASDIANAFKKAIKGSWQ